MAVEAVSAQSRLKDPLYQVFLLLRAAFTVAPILMAWMLEAPATAQRSLTRSLRKAA